MSNNEIIRVIHNSNIPEEQKQEIIKKIESTADKGKIAMIVIDFLKLGIEIINKFPPQ